MKKNIIVLLALVICTSVYAERYNFGKGITLVTYGNTAVIEDDNTQQTISLSIEKREDNSGRPVYDLFCGNKYTKGVAKTSLNLAISSIITSVAASVGGPAGAAAGGIISSYASSIASNIYDDVCDYYGDK